MNFFCGVYGVLGGIGMYWMMGFVIEIEMVLEGCVIKVLEDCLFIFDGLLGFLYFVLEIFEL